MLRGWAAALAVWSGVFGVVHVAWALGWRWGVPADQPPIGRRPVFLAYDLVAAAAMLAAAVVAALIAARPERLADRRLRLLVLVAAALAGLRGVIGLAGDVVQLAGGGVPAPVSVLADAWFVGAGAIGALLLLRSRGRGDPGGPGALSARRS